MRRQDLEHVIRAASAISGERELVIVGSSALLGAVPDPPEELARSRDVDLYPLRRPDLADLIDGSIGEQSPFEDRFGFYAQGVSPSTATLPAGWEARLVTVQNDNTQQNVGYCLEPHDLAASKLAAGRDKDRDFVRAMLRHRIVEGSALGERIEALPLPAVEKERLGRWLSAEVAQLPA
jgi:Nucleotidyltransferase of unknown function (DUF6036)